MINTMLASLQALSTLFLLKNEGTRPVFHRAWLASPLLKTLGAGDNHRRTCMGSSLERHGDWSYREAYIGLNRSSQQFLGRGSLGWGVSTPQPALEN